MVFEKIPAVDESNNFPTAVRQAIANSNELKAQYAHFNEQGELVINGVVIEIEPPDDPIPTAGLDTVGYPLTVFIENGGTIPPEAISPYTLVIEKE